MATLEDARDRLVKKLAQERRFLQRYDDYLEGEQGLKYLAPELREQLGTRLIDLIINLPAYLTDVFENRLDITGFRYASNGDGSGNDDLWNVWQHNDGDALSQQIHRESLALSRAYAIVGPGDSEEVPLITAQSAFDCIHEDDPLTRNVKYGIQRWKDEDGLAWINLFYPEGRTTWRAKDSGWVEDSHESDNGFNLPRIVPLMNDPRSLGRKVGNRRDQRLGRSVFHDTIPLVEALNKTMTDMLVSSEFHAMPRRWATGLKETDFTDENGNPLDTWSLIAGRIWGVTNEKASFGQFQEADLSNFHNTAKMLIQFCFLELGLPAHYLTWVGDNPASADAIRSSESQLVKRAERKQSVLSTRWERVQRLVLLTQGKRDDDAARQIETIWGDPATPTKAQKADAAVKLLAAKDGQGRSIITVQQAREDMGYTPGQQKRMAEADASNSDSSIAAAVKAAADAERAAAGAPDAVAS